MALDAFLARYKGQDIGMDLETTSLDPRHGRARLIQLYCGGQFAYCDLDTVGGLSALKPQLKGLRFVVFNAQFDCKWFLEAGITARWNDARMAYFALYGGCNGSRSSLKYLTDQFLNITLDKELQRLDWTVPVLSKEQIIYGLRDAEYTLKLWDYLVPFMLKANVVQGYNLLMGALPAVVAMEHNGIHFYAEQHKTYIQELKAQKEVLHQQLIDANAPVENWDSPKQLRCWLASEVPKSSQRQWDRTEKNQELATRRKALEYALDQHLVPASVAAILEIFLERKGLATLISNFGDTLASAVESNSRVYSSLHIAGCVSGHLSSSKPNLQQIPARSPKGKQFRKLFTAPPDRILIGCDLSQVEIRAAAALSEDVAMEVSFKTGEDNHRRIAAIFMDKPAETVTDEERSIAKAFTFRILYGGGAAGLARELNIPIKVAKTHIAKWLREYHVFDQWRQRLVGPVRKTGEIRTAGGRRIKVSRELSAPKIYNYPVQGASADVLYVGLRIYAQEYLKQHPDWKLLIAVHDELLLEVPKADVEAGKEALFDSMTRGFQKIFPNAPTRDLAEPKSGQTWSELK
jgi:DNA polymerase-1